MNYKPILFILIVLIITAQVFAITSTGLVAYWNLDDQNTTALDSKGGYNGTIAATTTYNLSGKIGTSVGQATATNGISIPDSGAFREYDTNVYTICAWVYPYSNPSAWTDIIKKRQTANGQWLYGLGISNVNKYYYISEVGSLDARRSTVSTTIDLNVWTFVCGERYVTENQKVYKNGTSYDASNYGTTYTTTGNGIFALLADTTFKGKIDEVSWWNISLTDTNISDLNGGGTAPLTYCSATNTFATSCAAASTCAYSGSGDWMVNLADNCNLTTDTTMAVGGIFQTYGTGSLTINAFIRGCGSAHLIGNDIYWKGKGFQ